MFALNIFAYPCLKDMTYEALMAGMLVSDQWFVAHDLLMQQTSSCTSL